MKRDLRNGGFQLNARVPGTAPGTMKAAAIGTGVCESRVNNVRLRNAVKQFARPNAEVASRLRVLPFIRGSFQFV